jgi:hypothetical protein
MPWKSAHEQHPSQWNSQNAGRIRLVALEFDQRRSRQGVVARLNQHDGCLDDHRDLLSESQHMGRRRMEVETGHVRGKVVVV